MHEITTRRRGAIAVVELAGEIDLDAADAARAAMSEAVGPSIGVLEVDLSGVTFIDSSGLHVLLDVAQVALAAGADFVLLHPSERVTAVLDVTGYRKVFAIIDNPPCSRPAAGDRRRSPGRATAPGDPGGSESRRAVVHLGEGCGAVSEAVPGRRPGERPRAEPIARPEG